MVIITKLEAAHRQLTTAIRLYIADDDVAAIHTLACAAREIYERHCEAHGVERMFEQIEAANPERTRKQLWEILNRPRNFLKHPGTSRDLSAQLDLDDEMNAAMLWVAPTTAQCCAGTRSRQKYRRTPFGSLLHAFRETLAPMKPMPSGQTRSWETLSEATPGLREAAPAEQKRIGKTMVQAARDIVRAAPPTA